MMNLNLLPIARDRKARLRKLSALYWMYGDITVDVLAVIEDQVLVAITYPNGDLPDWDLIERADMLFNGEIEELCLHYVVWRERPRKLQHFLSADGATLFHVGKNPFVMRVTRGTEEADVVIGHQRYMFDLLAGTPQHEQVKDLKRWLKSGVLDGRLTLCLEDPSPPPMPSEAQRPIAEVLEEVFNRSPLPKWLEKPKQDWLKGRLRETSQMRIVEAHTRYTCMIICREKA